MSTEERGWEWLLVFLLCLRLRGVVTKVHTHDSVTAELGKQPSGFSRLTGLTKETAFQVLSLGAKEQ